MDVRAILWLLGVAIAAGGYIEGFRRLKRDVNGVGNRQRKFENNAKNAMIALEADEEKRKWLASHFRE